MSTPPAPSTTAASAPVCPPAPVPASVAPSRSRRHWQVLRRALLSGSRHSCDDSLQAIATTASSASTEFFQLFPSTPVVGPPAAPAPDAPEHNQHQREALQEDHPEQLQFVWKRLVLAPFHESKPLFLREQSLLGRGAMHQLLSHRVNQGVDNTGNIRTWPSEQVLLYYLIKHQLCDQLVALAKEPKRLNCCELGAGMVGLASLGLVLHNSQVLNRVLITDGNPAAVKNLQHCVQANVAPSGGLHATLTDGQQSLDSQQVNLQVQLLRWDRAWQPDPIDYQQFDLLLASDCLFFEEFHVDLLHTIHMLLKPVTGRCVLLQPNRNDSLTRFCALATSSGFEVTRTEQYDDQVWQMHQAYCVAQPQVYEKDVHLPVLLVLSRRQ